MNLGELYISIEIDDSGVDKVSGKFDELTKCVEGVMSEIQNLDKSLGSIETSMVAELATGFDKASSSGGEATETTKSLAEQLEEAVTKGNLLADVMEKAFSKVVSLAKDALDAVKGFVTDAVDGFASYEQNIESMGRTFDSEGQNLSGEMLRYFQENSAAFGMSVNEMMEHVNKTGVILQKDNAQRRAQEAEGEKASTEEQKQEVDNRLANFRAGLQRQASELKQAQSQELASWKNYYSDEYDALKENLSRELDEFKQNNDRIYEERRSALDKSLKALSDSLDDEYSALQSQLDRQVEAQRRANERELRDKSSAITAAYNATKKVLDAEVTAYQKATDARVKQINREYTERYKLIDEEKYAQLKALQDQIDALDEQDEAASRSAQERADAEKVAELTYKAQHAKYVEDRAEAAADLAKLETDIQDRKDKQLRSDQKSGLKKQMEAVRDHFDDMKSKLKEQQTEEVSQYKASRADGLAELRASNAERLAEMKAAGQAEVQAIRDAQADLIKQMQADNKRLLAEKKRSNKEIVDQQKADNKAELSELKRSLSEQEKERQRSNSARLKEQKRAQDEQLNQLRQSQADEMAQVKEHNRLLLQEETAAAKARKKAIADAAKEGPEYAAVTDEDRLASWETLKNLMKTAADVGAARNMTTSEVLDIFESMNYGRFATFDNLGLGYANKTGIAKMVSDMSSVVNRELDPENFNDVATALKALVDQFNMSGRAATEARTTVSGSFNALKATWDNFKTSLATESPDDENVFLDQLLGTGDEEGALERYLRNLIPVVRRVIERIVEFIKERGPEIAQRLKEAIPDDLLPPEIKENLDKAIETAKNLAVALANIAPHIPTIINAVGAFGGFVAVLETMKKIKEIVDFLNGDKGLKTLTDSLGGLGGSAGGAAGGFDELGRSAGGSKGALDDLDDVAAELAGGAALGGAEASAGTLGGTLAGVLGPTAIATGAVAGLGLLLNHILEVTGATEEFHKAVENGTYNATEQYTHMSDSAVEAHAKVSEAYNGAAADIDASTSAAAKSVSDSTSKIAESVKQQSEGTGNWTEAIKGFFNNMTTSVTTSSGEMKSKITADSQELANGVTVNTSTMSTGWNQTMSNMKTNAEASFGGIKVQTASMLSDMKTEIDSARPSFEEAGANVTAGIKKGIAGDDSSDGGILGTLKTMMGNAINGLREFLGIHSPSTVFEEIGQNTILGYKEGVSGPSWEDVLSFFRGVPGMISGTFDGASSMLSEAGGAIVDGLRSGAEGGWGAVSEFFGNRQGAISEFFNNAQNWLDGAGNMIIDGLNQGLGNGWQYVQSFLGDIPNMFMDMFSYSDRWLVGAGSSIIDGLWNGMLDVWGDVQDWVSGVGQWISDNKGPEEYDRKLLVSNGMAIMEGLGSGMRSRFESDVMPFVSDLAGEMEGMMGTPSIDLSDSFSGIREGTQKVVDAFREMGREISSEWRRVMDGMMADTVGYMDGTEGVMRGAALPVVQVAGAPSRQSVNQPTIVHATLELDRVQFGRLVYQLNGEESQRVGVRLSGGYA